MSLYPWIYVDYTDNIWKFFKNDNGDLCYKIMYEDEKWTKINTIDKDVLDFTVCIDYDDTIHILYSNKKGELKYCTIKDKQWMGKIIQSIEGELFKISELGAKIIGNEMHIFYLLKDNSKVNHGTLMHLIWSGKDIKSNKIGEITLLSNVNKHYVVNSDEDGIINLVFVSDEGIEAGVNYCNYDGKWTVNRIYGILGEKIDIEILKQDGYLHILNKYFEIPNYCLVHIRIDNRKIIEDFDVYKSSKEIKDAFLVTINEKLYSCWLEENSIFYSSFTEIWEEANSFEFNSDSINRYFCYSARGENVFVEKINIYGTDGENLKLFFPDDFVLNDNSEEKALVFPNPKEKMTLHDLEKEFSKLRLENRNLHKTISTLNMQLQRMKKYIKNYETRITKAIEEKEKAEENSKLFMELHQNIQNNFENIKAQLHDEKNLKSSIEAQLKNALNENIVLKQQIEKLNTEKEKLKTELDIEKNKSFLERLFE